MKATLSLLALLLVASVAHAGVPVVKLFAGANAVASEGSLNLPSDYELGATARASLTPHVSLVGSAFYGLGREYTRASIGPRITATDVDDPNFSIGFGIEYVTCTKPEVRPKEWAPDAVVGWKPAPERWPRVVLGAQGSYGLDSRQAYLYVAARYELAAF